MLDGVHELAHVAFTDDGEPPSSNFCFEGPRDKCPTNPTALAIC